jgi:hypothetical protein
MVEFVETVRESSAITAQCSIFEQMIVDETNHRQQIVTESSSIADVLSFDENSISLPKIVRHDPIPSSDADSKRNDQLLRDTRSAILSLEIPRHAQDLEPEAALEIARFAESQWNLRSAGTYSLRNEIQRLQRAATEGDSLLRKTQAARDAEEQKNTEASLRSHQEEVAIEASARESSLEFARELEEFDDQLRHLKQRANSSADLYGRIRREILELDSEPEEFRLEPESPEEEDLFDFSDEGPDLSLVRQRTTLQREVADLRERLVRERKAAKHRQAALVAAIGHLNARCRGYRRKVRLSDDSPIKDDLAALINRIDSSIIELQRDFA